jgi:FKBP12-rapamycin complex-associated protein
MVRRLFFPEGEQLTETGKTKFMHDRYVEVCDQIFQYKDHREPLVRRAVIELIPTLASYNQTEFKELYLHKSMLYLLGQLKKDRDRTTCCVSPLLAGRKLGLMEGDASSAFQAIGHVAMHVKSQMAPYLDAILISIKEGLQARGSVSSLIPSSEYETKGT